MDSIAVFASSFAIQPKAPGWRSVSVAIRGLPPEVVANKGDWIPLPAQVPWIPQLGNLDSIPKDYYTTTESESE